MHAIRQAQGVLLCALIEMGRCCEQNADNHHALAGGPHHLL